MNPKLPTLELIQIATPCEASWDDMKGDNRVRFCGQCKLHVYNISDMPRDEAEQLVSEREGRLCVRMFRRHDGTVLTSDCPVGLRAVRQRLVRSAAALAGLLIAMIGGTAFGSRINRWLPSGFRAPAESLAEWVEPAPKPIACQPPVMGKMVMGDIAPFPIQAPPVPVSPVGGDGNVP